MPKTAQIVTGMVLAVGIILAVTKLSVDSLNPIDVFQSENLLAKIVVGFFLFGLGMQTLSLVSWKLFIQRGLEDERCPGQCDGRPILGFTEAYGQPVRCMFCRRWYHRRCFVAGGGSAFGGCRQAHCPSGRGVA